MMRALEADELDTPTIRKRNIRKLRVPVSGLGAIAFILLLYCGFQVPAHETMIRNLRSKWTYETELPSKETEKSMESNGTISEGRSFLPVVYPDTRDLRIVWLMSFPNSGTSYTTKLIRHSGMVHTATNYGHENWKRAKGLSIPVFEDMPDGPYWMEQEIHPEYNFPKRYVLVKTHCGGRCEDCGPERYLESTYSFRRKCLTAKRRTYINGTKHDEKVEYPPDRVSKAIHMVRDPFDNIVSRFNMETRGNRSAIGYNHTEKDFRAYCEGFNERFRREEEKSHLFDEKLLTLVKDVPCHADFFRYVEWHNMCAMLTDDQNLDTLVLYYDDYETKFDSTKKRILKFMAYKDVGAPEYFIAGKKYGHYYSEIEKQKIKSAVKSLATQQTWSIVERYFTDIRDLQTASEV